MPNTMNKKIKKNKKNKKNKKIKKSDLLNIIPLKTKYISGQVVICNHQFNAELLISLHPRWKKRFEYDELSNCIYYNAEKLTDYHIHQFISWCIDWYDIEFSKKNVMMALDVVSRKNTTNPLKDYLISIGGTKDNPSWDPEKEDPKLESFLTKYFGVKPSQLSKKYFKNFMVAVCTRIFDATVRKPIKFDTCLVFYGEQGIKKSTAISVLCFQEMFGSRYFSDTPLDISKLTEAQMKIQGKVIYELKELAKRTNDKRQEKAFLDSQIDRLRFPYATLPVEVPRITCFIATVNDPAILNDATGSRRFWCVKTGEYDPKTGKAWKKHQKVDIEELERNVVDLWREAIFYMYREDQFWLTDDEEDIRADLNEDFANVHPWTKEVLSISSQRSDLATRIDKTRKDREGQYLHVKEIDKFIITAEAIMMDMGFRVSDFNRKNKSIVESILMSNGYRKTRKLFTVKTNPEKTESRHIRCWRKR